MGTLVRKLNKNSYDRFIGAAFITIGLLMLVAIEGIKNNFFLLFHVLFFVF